MKNRTMFRIITSQVITLILLIFLTLGNEIIDIPHYLFNNAPTTFSQRFGEVIIEISIFVTGPERPECEAVGPCKKPWLVWNG